MTDTVAPVALGTEPEPRPYNAITHTCGAWWTGTSRSHCPAEGCHLTFSCDSAAAAHRIGKFGIDRRCVDPSTVGLVSRQMPYGLLWGWPSPEGGYEVLRQPTGPSGEDFTVNGERI